MGKALFEEGVYVSGFGFPVVPQGQARLRCQVSAAHERADLDRAVDAFEKVGKEVRGDLTPSGHQPSPLSALSRGTGDRGFPLADGTRRSG